jgi:hypothetical protein
MQRKTEFRTVWSHRSAKSIFGPASSPVNRNGRILCFETEDQARAECDRLNAVRSSSLVRYTIQSARDLPVETGLVALADGFRGSQARWQRGAERRSCRLPSLKEWCRRVGLNY